MNNYSPLSSKIFKPASEIIGNYIYLNLLFTMELSFCIKHSITQNYKSIKKINFINIHNKFTN